MSYATAALATYTNMLGTLDQIVSKACEHEKGDALLQSRLAEDMFPLATQIRFTCSQALMAANRLGQLGLELDDSDITSLADAKARIATAREVIAAIDATSWPAADTIVDFELPNGMAFTMQAHEYVRDWAIPQFYFHLMTTYAILRAEGLPLGKADYVPFMARYAKAPATS